MEALRKNQTIQEFLLSYPKHEWERCIEALLVYSVKSIKRKYPFGLMLEQLYSIGEITQQNLEIISINISPVSHPSNARSNPSKKHKRERKNRNVKEPILCSKDEATILMNSSNHAKKSNEVPESPSNSLLRMADEFLSNPFTSTITRNPSLLNLSQTNVFPKKSIHRKSKTNLEIPINYR